MFWCGWGGGHLIQIVTTTEGCDDTAYSSDNLYVESLPPSVLVHLVKSEQCLVQKARRSLWVHVAGVELSHAPMHVAKV